MVGRAKFAVLKLCTMYSIEAFSMLLILFKKQAEYHIMAKRKPRYDPQNQTTHKCT